MLRPISIPKRTPLADGSGPSQFPLELWGGLPSELAGLPRCDPYVVVSIVDGDPLHDPVALKGARKPNKPNKRTTKARGLLLRSLAACTFTSVCECVWWQTIYPSSDLYPSMFYIYKHLNKIAKDKGMGERLELPSSLSNRSLKSFRHFTTMILFELAGE